MIVRLQHRCHNHNRDQKVEYPSFLFMLLIISVSTPNLFLYFSIITFSCHNCPVRQWLHADSLKVTFVLQIKAAISEWRPVTDVCGSGWVKNSLIAWKTGTTHRRRWLRCISSCVCFVGVSWTVVDLQIDFSSWNETLRRIGYVDSSAVKGFLQTGASSWTSSSQSNNLIYNCNPCLTVTILEWREM